MARIAGSLFISIDGVQHNVIGDWTLNLGIPKKEPMIGADRYHGYKEMPQNSTISGAVRDSDGISVTALRQLTDATITAEMANGKTYVFRNMTEGSDGNMTTEEASVEVMFFGPDQAAELFAGGGSSLSVSATFSL